MSLKKILVPGDPYMVAAFYGTSANGFQPNQSLILFSKETRLACIPYIRKVFDHGNNCFMIDLE
jgi:hypothetical protein